MPDFDAVEIDDEYDSSEAESDDEEIHPWEWTIVLAHLHRTKHAVESGADPMKLRFHGLEDHSDHDLQDWQDALSVVSARLNPIALRRAHIKEELTIRRKQHSSNQGVSSFESGDVKGKQSRDRGDSVLERMEVHDRTDHLSRLQ